MTQWERPRERVPEVVGVDKPAVIEFLRARLDERHARAAKLLRYAQENDLAVRDPRLLGRHVPGWHEWPEVEQMAREVLAEVEAKRWLVDRAEHVMVNSRDHAEVTAWLHVVQRLALPVADHPDYDVAWKP